jgi:hypothetical protein
MRPHRNVFGSRIGWRHLANCEGGELRKNLGPRCPSCVRTQEFEWEACEQVHEQRRSLGRGPLLSLCVTTSQCESLDHCYFKPICIARAAIGALNGRYI